MSKSKGPSLPEVPSFQADPNYGWSQDQLKSQYNYLINGLTTQGGSLSGLLGEAVNLSPDISRLATERYVAAQEPAYRRGFQDITNTLEANNQLTGSTTGSALQNYQNDYLSGLTAANAEMAIQDINRALSNRVSLYGTGLNTAQAVGSSGLQNQQQMNQFALSNYENQVAQAMLAQQQQSGGLFGGLLGAGGGALIGGIAGTLIAPGIGTAIGAGLGAGLGGTAGAIGPTSAGPSLMSGGSSAIGAYAGGNRNIISNPGAGARSETISNSLYDTPSWYRSGLGSSSSYGL